ncbi:MAG: hypothetical protein ABUT20_25350 [Bacteroidota bacterium]
MSKYIFLIALVISFSSCITSLNQIVTYDKVTTENRITGKWQQNDNSIYTVEELMKSSFYKSITTATVDNHEKNTGFDSKEDSLLYSKSYVLSFTKSGYNYIMIASLMRMNNELYADFLPASATPAFQAAPAKSEELYSGYQASHTVAKIIFHDSSLEIKFLNGNFIRSQMSKGSIAVKYEYDSLFNTSLITASPAELQQFLMKYGKDERLYSTENTINLKKI